MLLNQETLRLVFGLKLKNLRLEKGLSLKDLSKRTGLSPSYLNEIEKGKKYPKTEKILLLAQALNQSLEDLISLELKKEFQLIQHLLNNKLLTGIPFDIFGIPSQTVFELLSNHPKKMQALIGTIGEISRSHQITVDDMLFAFLRSYLNMHHNYFHSIEVKAHQTREKYHLPPSLSTEELYHRLNEILIHDFKVKVIPDENFEALFQKKVSLEFFTLNHDQTLYLSHLLNLKEKIFILARELGYRILKAKTRLQTSLTYQLDSFEQLFNHFSASYFAGSLLIPESHIKEQLQTLFNKKTWDTSHFLNLMNCYPCTIETFFHRMTQVFPHHLNIGQLFYLRFEFDLKTKKYQVSKELHLSSLHSPHKIQNHEHYCRRWLIHQLTTKHLDLSKSNNDQTVFGIQRSHFINAKNEYLVLASSFTSQNKPNKVTSVCLGFLLKDKIEEKIPFINDQSIPNLSVGESCERCTLANCHDRQAAFDPEISNQNYSEILNKISLLSQNTDSRF